MSLNAFLKKKKGNRGKGGLAGQWIGPLPGCHRLLILQDMDAQDKTEAHRGKGLTIQGLDWGLSLSHPYPLWVCVSVAMVTPQEGVRWDSCGG